MSLPSPSPLWISSTIADIVETFSAPSVQRRTPSRRPLKSRYGSVKRASRSSKADFPLIPLPPITPLLPSPSPPSFPPTYLLQWTEEGASLSYLMCTIKDRPSAKTPHLHVTSGSGVEGFVRCMSHRSVKGFIEETSEPCDGIGWSLVGIVCICFCAFATPVDCQRAETERTKHHPSLLSSYSHLHCCLASLAMARWLLCEFVKCAGSVVRRCKVSVTLQEWLGGK